MVFSASVRRLAAVVSWLGHPLVTTTAFAVFMAGRLQGAAAAWVLGSVVALTVFIGLWSLRQTRRGVYSNFDVSQRTQRRSFYPVLVSVVGLATATLFWQSVGQFRYGLLFVWLQLLLCYGLNFWLKVSLHATLSFFLACAVLHLHAGWGLLAMGIATLIAASRLVLQRHTLPELVVGTLVGLTAGAGLVWLLPHLAA